MNKVIYVYVIDSDNNNNNNSNNNYYYYYNNDDDDDDDDAGDETLAWYGTQPHGPPCGSTISVLIYFIPLKTSKARLQMQSS